MPKVQIRLSPATLEAAAELGHRCGIADIDTLIALLVRKYGQNLANLLAPGDPTVPAPTAAPTVPSDRLTAKSLAGKPPKIEGFF
jgi:hypothetical protein